MLTTGIARLVKEPTVRTLNDGRRVADLDFAYNYGRKKDDEQYRPSQFVQAPLWDPSPAVLQYLTKGKSFLVEMRNVHVETFTGNDGVQKSKLRAEAIKLNFLPGGGGSERPEPAYSASNAYAKASGASSAPVTPPLPEDDCPF
jgi:single-stranded DNA-binding protein